MRNLTITAFVIEQSPSTAIRIAPPDSMPTLLRLMERDVLVPAVPTTAFDGEALLLAYRRSDALRFYRGLLIPTDVVMTACASPGENGHAALHLCRVLWMLSNDTALSAKTAFSEAAQALMLCFGIDKALHEGMATSAGGLSTRLQRVAFDFMMSRIDSPFRIADVAARCGVSEGHFKRAFRVTTGLPPRQWLLTRRMDLATKLLAETQMTLVDVASACGFAEQSHFSKVFSKYAGAPPGLWSREAGVRS